LWRAFPQLAVEVEILVHAKDRVAWQRRVTGKQEGAFQGAAGRFAEDQVVTDLAERLSRARRR
jgi:hypothetical protein